MSPASRHRPHPEHTPGRLPDGRPRCRYCRGEPVADADLANYHHEAHRLEELSPPS